MLRVLHANNDNKNMGGAYIVERELDPHMREHGYVFDYITMDEFIESGNTALDPLPDAKTFSARLRDNRWIGHIKLPLYVRNVIKSNGYKIIHIDIDLAWKALLYAVPAKHQGCKVVIHSHSTGVDGDHKKLKLFLHKCGRKILKKYADYYIAPSQEAMDWFLPEHSFEKSKLIYNGIDSSKFFYDSTIREKMRIGLGITDEFVIGNVGRVNDNKNQVFLVDILCEVREKINNAKLLLVGAYTDETYAKLMARIKEHRLEKEVMVVGEKSDVNSYLNAMDYFIIPSIFEGFPLVSIEAQASGLRCLVSDSIPDVAISNNSVKRMSLSDGAKKWAQAILDDTKNDYTRRSGELDSRYTLRGMAEEMSKVYDEVLKAGDR